MYDGTLNHPMSQLYPPAVGLSLDDNNYYYPPYGNAPISPILDTNIASPFRKFSIGSNQANTLRHSMDDSVYIGDARMNRIAQAEAAIRQDMFKDCTFRPQIKPLPAHYGAMKELDTPFQDRVAKWQRERELELQKKAQAIQQSELVDCTFHPKISKNSQRAVKELRGELITEDPANERLYKSSIVSNEQKLKMIEEAKSQEETKELEGCTFQPRLSTNNNLFRDINPKYGLPLSSNDYDDASKTRLTKECTFTPKVNPIKPSMSAAKLYTSTNVIERLSKPAVNTSLDNSTSRSEDDAIHEHDENTIGDKNVMDVSTFMGSLSKSHRTLQRPINASHHENKPSSALTEEEIEAKKLRFKQFINRQNELLKKRNEDLKDIERQITPAFQPFHDQPHKTKRSSSATRSVSTNQDPQQDTVKNFLNRMESYTQKKIENVMELQQRNAYPSESDKNNCTFQPKINKKSLQMRSRTSFEMSKGDLVRTETNRRMLKLQLDQEELSKLTFQPKISKYAAIKGKSELQLSSDPSAFLKKYKEKEDNRKITQEMELRRREEEESVGCSFVPQTKDCPEYIKRIAKSMAIVKAARNSSGSTEEKNVHNKPDWR